MLVQELKSHVQQRGDELPEDNAPWVSIPSLSRDSSVIPAAAIGLQEDRSSQNSSNEQVAAANAAASLSRVARKLSSTLERGSGFGGSEEHPEALTPKAPTDRRKAKRNGGKRRRPKVGSSSLHGPFPFASLTCCTFSRSPELGRASTERATRPKSYRRWAGGSRGMVIPAGCIIGTKTPNRLSGTNRTF